MPSVAFVINPTLPRDPAGFGRRCLAAAAERGWEAWLAETTEREDGFGLARDAVTAGARLVFAAGGDGTVRACAQALAGTEIPLAIVPLGTANLTARAVGVPTRVGRAIEAGFDGRDHRIDLAAIEMDQNRSEQISWVGGTSEAGDGTSEAGDGTDGAGDGTDGAADGADGTGNGTDGTEDSGDGTRDGADGTGDGADGTRDGTDGTGNGTAGTEDSGDGTGNGADGTGNGTGRAADGADRAAVGGDGAGGAADGAGGAGDGGGGAVYTAMAGIGLDAAVVAGAGRREKRWLGWVAYAVSGVARLALPEQEFAVRLDGGAALVRRARCVVVGNAGLLPGGFTLLPEARLDDGLLDVGILAPGGLAGWARVAGRVLTHRRPGRRPDRLGGRSTGEEPDGARGRGNGGDLEWFRARRVEVRAGTVLPRQIDGEVTTPGRTLNVSVRPGSLTIRLPK